MLGFNFQEIFGNFMFEMKSRRQPKQHETVVGFSSRYRALVVWGMSSLPYIRQRRSSDKLVAIVGMHPLTTPWKNVVAPDTPLTPSPAISDEVFLITNTAARRPSAVYGDPVNSITLQSGGRKVNNITLVM
jgi:hypothetical protein